VAGRDQERNRKKEGDADSSGNKNQMPHRKTNRNRFREKILVVRTPGKICTQHSDPREGEQRGVENIPFNINRKKNKKREESEGGARRRLYK